MYWMQALKKALATAWAANEALSAAAPLMFERMSKGMKFPKVTFQLSALPEQVAQGAIREVTLKIHVISDKATSEEADMLMAGIVELLEGAALELEGGYRVSNGPQLEAEGQAVNEAERWQGTLEFSLRIH